MLDTVTRKTELLDVRRQPHVYVSHMHGAVAGIALGTELLGLLGETMQLHKGLGACISGMAAGVIQRGDIKLIERLLQHTSRDGTMLDKAGIETAYQANYGELLSALAWVIEENFGSFSEAAALTLAPRLTSFLQPKSPVMNWLVSLATGASGQSSPQGSAPT